MSVFRRLEKIQYSDPELTPENWCQHQPCKTVQVGSRSIILSQPSSSVLVYLLGVLTVGVGLLFLVDHNSEASRWWWGIALQLWGVGALLAGTSYQIFGYHIKCSGRSVCVWTSWWELVYLVFQQLSMNALLLAVAYSTVVGGVLFRVLLVYAVATSMMYFMMVLVGGLIPVKRLITFEWMVWYCLPGFLFMVGINGWRALILHAPLDLALVVCWAILLVVMLFYWLYDRAGFTEKLWANGRGVWFSQNDVLHIGLILWMVYIAAVVLPLAHDILPLV